MMNGAMMNGNMMSGGMMWAMGLVWFLVIVLLVLSIAALVKYVFTGNQQRNRSSGTRNDAD